MGSPSIQVTGPGAALQALFADDAQQLRTHLPDQARDDLLQLLDGCCHPRVGRLRTQLAANPNGRQIDDLRSEVVRLITACYGPAEARRRLRELVTPA